MHTLSRLFICFVLLGLVNACSEASSGDNSENAIITGTDFRRCQCCGGIMFTFTNNSVKYEAPYYQWFGNPIQFGIDPGVDEAIAVKIDFTYVREEECGGSSGVISIGNLEFR